MLTTPCQREFTAASCSTLVLAVVPGSVADPGVYDVFTLTLAGRCTEVISMDARLKH